MGKVRLRLTVVMLAIGAVTLAARGDVTASAILISTASIVDALTEGSSK